MTMLCSTCLEIDDLFLMAFERSLALETATAGDWKLNLTISPKDEVDFRRSIRVYKIHSEISNLSFLRDEDEIRFWRLAIDFLVFEKYGFPGRQILLNGKPEAFPTPDVYASGLSRRVLEVEKVALRLPYLVIAAIRSISHLSELGNIVGHIRKRIDLLDSLLESTFSARTFGQPLVSLATEIGQSWYSLQHLFSRVFLRDSYGI